MALPDDLAAELEGPPWMYEFELAPGMRTPGYGPTLEHHHRSRLDMIGPPATEALARAGGGARAIDLGCNEGWFCHRLLEWGAGEVVGIDARERNVRRAELVRDHFGMDPNVIRFECGDVLELEPEELGEFDVVLVLGLIYHLESPVSALRIARALTRSLCAVETQLTRQVEPIRHGWGGAEADQLAEGSFAARIEHDQESNPLAAVGGVLSLIPNWAAVEEMATVAGFATIERVEPQPHHEGQYLSGDRAVALCRVG
jgi:SAM-dependent methyltransferase